MDAEIKFSDIKLVIGGGLFFLAIISMIAMPFGNSKNINTPTSGNKQTAISSTNVNCSTISRGPTCRTQVRQGGIEFSQTCYVQAYPQYSPVCVKETGKLTFLIEKKVYEYPGQNPVIVCNIPLKVENSASINPNPILTGGASLSTGTLMNLTQITKDGVTGTLYIWSFTFFNKVDTFIRTSTTVEMYMLIGNGGINGSDIGKYSVKSGASISWSSIINTVLQAGTSFAQ